MLINTTPFVEDDTVFVVAKDEQNNCWIIIDPEEGFGEKEYCVVEFGASVLIMLNRFSSNETNNLLTLDAFVHNELSDEKSNIKMDKTIWDKHFTNICEFINGLSLKSEKEKCDFYNKYKNIMFYLQSGQPFPEYGIIPNHIKKGYITGGFTMIEGRRMPIRHVIGFANMFIMDLEELLFNRNINIKNIKMKLCTRCKKYFRTSNAHRLICEDCSENKDTYINKQFEKITKLYRIITNKLVFHSNKGDFESLAKEKMFKEEYAFYYDIVRYGKSNKPFLKNYDDSIQTPEDLIDWLKRFDESISKRKRKDEDNGKTNEKGKRDRSDR